ncbi:MAG TPA: HD domain-containing phosphohydrolase [Chloroflexota bacterium]|nr:HD domain-containing phosphohydrolase [Chloroflexota bacterium]
MHIGAAACLLYLLGHYPLASLFSWSALFWLILSLIANYSVIQVFAGGTPSSISAGFTVAAAIVVLFNPLVAAILVAVGTLDARDFKRQRRLSLTLYSRSMYAICAGAAALLFRRLMRAYPMDGQVANLIVAIGVTVIVYFIVNTTLTRAIVAALDDEPFFERYPFKGDLLLGYLFQGFVAMILVLLARQSQAMAVLVIGPLWGVRFSLQKVVELREINEQLVQSFADALDLRDHDTAGHTRRVATLARLIGRQLGLSRRSLDNIYAAGSLHDLGKIGIPDAILLKAGTLERDEWDEMKKHPVMGASLLAPYRHLQQVTAIMRHHHERFDGSGYPDGLTGSQIPLGARVITVADTFMVITDGRQYRAARTVDEAIAEIQRCAGSQFDPAVVEAFLSLDPFSLRRSIDAMDIADKGPVLQSLAPHPAWARLLGFKAA